MADLFEKGFDDGYERFIGLTRGKFNTVDPRHYSSDSEIVNYAAHVVEMESETRWKHEFSSPASLKRYGEGYTSGIINALQDAARRKKRLNA